MKILVRTSELIRNHLLAGMIFLFVSFYQCGIYLWPFSRVPGDNGDSRFNMIVLEHGYKTIRGDESLFSLNIFYPFKNTGGFSDLLIGSNLGYSIFRFLGIGMFTSFQLWIFLGITLNFWIAYIVSRKLKLNPLGAILSALIFTFSLPVLAQTNHLQLLWRFPVPLIFYYALKLKQNRTNFPKLIFWISFSFLCSTYIGIFTLIFLIVMLIIKYFVKSNEIESKSAAPRHAYIEYLWKAASIILTIFTVYVLLRYFQIAKSYGINRSWGETVFYSPQLMNWLQTDGSILWKPIDSIFPASEAIWEKQLFIGVATLILLIVGIMRGFTVSGTLKLLVKTTIVCGIIITAVGSFSFFYFLHLLPGVNSIRVPGRFILVMIFPIGLLAGNFLDQLPHLSRKAALVGVILVDLVLVSTASTTADSFFDRAKRLEKQYSTEIASYPKVPILVLPEIDNDWTAYSALDGVILANNINRPALNGYSGFFPNGFPTTNNCAEISKWYESLGSKSPLKSDMSSSALAFNSKLICILQLK